MAKIASNILSVFSLANEKEKEEKKLEDERAMLQAQKTQKKKKGNFHEMIRKIQHALGGYPRFVVRANSLLIYLIRRDYTLIILRNSPFHQL